MLVRSADGSLQIEEERTTAMLALTAIHDIFKVECFLPLVACNV